MGIGVLNPRRPFCFLHQSNTAHPDKGVNSVHNGRIDVGGSPDPHLWPISVQGKKKGTKKGAPLLLARLLSCVLTLCLRLRCGANVTHE